jgi:hypothetical protein
LSYRAAAAALLWCIWPPMWRCDRRWGANFQDLFIQAFATKHTKIIIIITIIRININNKKNNEKEWKRYSRWGENWNPKKNMKMKKSRIENWAKSGIEMK